LLAGSALPAGRALADEGGAGAELDASGAGGARRRRARRHLRVARVAREAGGAGTPELVRVDGEAGAGVAARQSRARVLAALAHPR